jgi:hypothetical protein
VLAPVPADANFTKLTRKEVQSPTQAKKTTTTQEISKKRVEKKVIVKFHCFTVLIAHVAGLPPHG